MDPLTFNLIIQLQLEECQELTSRVKGKGREGTFSDAELALQIYNEDLEANSEILSDRKMAESIAIAVLQDGRLIHNEYRREHQIACDREFATNLEQESHLAGPTSAASGGNEQDDGTDIWSDDEMLSKAAVLYMCDPQDLGSSQDILDSDSEEGTVAESSAFAAKRNPKDKPRTGHCIICDEDKNFVDVARVPCKHGHEYCRECIAKLFRLSITDESLFPPRCDGAEIPLQHVRIFLPVDLAKEFEAKYVELKTKNRTYCHDKRCSTFIPSAAIVNEIGTCPHCRKTTCATCKNVSHSGDCPEDTALQQLVDTANVEEWQRCYQCSRFVDLSTGCNHITCLCGAHFCYICGQRWKTCECPQWHEGRLYERAAQVLDRIPDRRLFQPERVAHQQPIAPVPPRAVATPATSQAAVTPGPSRVVATSSTSQAVNTLTPVDENPVPTASPSPFAGLEPRSAENQHLLTAQGKRIDEVMQYLRTNHECDHDEWRWVRGRHTCEECHHVLKEYIFQCKQCLLRACNRCRRNRL